MNSVTAKDAIEHYRFRLAATSFGQWVSWLSQVKSTQNDNDDRAVEYEVWTLQNRVLSKFRSGLDLSKAAAYNYCLGTAMRDLLMMKRGLQGLYQYFVKQQEPTRARIKLNVAKSANISRNQYRTRIRKLFFRWKTRSGRAANYSFIIRSVICGGKNLDSESSFRSVVRESLVKWLRFTARRVKLSRQLKLSVKCWKWFAKRRICGILVRAHNISTGRRIRNNELDSHLTKNKQRMLICKFKKICSISRMKISKFEQIVAEITVRKARRVLAMLRSATLKRKQRITRNMQLHRDYQLSVRIKVMRKLLRLVKTRITHKVPMKTRIQMFLLHNWAVRRRSAGVVKWECYVGWRRLERRRYKIAGFHNRDRNLRSAFRVACVGLCRMAKHRRSACIGESHRRRKLLYWGMRLLGMFRSKKAAECIGVYRAVLCWRFWREMCGLKRWSQFSALRREKRNMLLEARDSRALIERRAACAEILRVAYEYPFFHCNFRVRGAAAVAMTERQWSLAVLVVQRWKVFVIRKRDIRRNQRSVIHKVNTLVRPNSLTGVAVTMKDSSQPQRQLHGQTEISNFHFLSRASPRPLAAECVPLPVPPQETHLDFRQCDASAVSSCNGYSYLLSSAHRLRQLPTKSEPEHATILKQDYDLARDAQPRLAIKNSLSFDNIIQQVSQPNEDPEQQLSHEIPDRVMNPVLSGRSTEHHLNSPLTEFAISDELIAVVGQVLDTQGTLNPVALRALREYIDLQKVLFPHGPSATRA